MHLGRCVRTSNRSQSVGPETAKENLSLEIETASGSVSLTNPRSKRHGYLLSCLEKKLNGQVQLKSTCAQLLIRNLFSSSSYWPYTIRSVFSFAVVFFPRLLLIANVSSGESLRSLIAFNLLRPTSRSSRQLQRVNPSLQSFVHHFVSSLCFIILLHVIWFARVWSRFCIGR